MRAIWPSSEWSRARAASAFWWMACRPKPSRMESNANTPMPMRRRLMAGPRSAKGRVARLRVIRMGLAHPRQCASDGGDAGVSKRGGGACLRAGSEVDDAQLGVADPAGEAFRASIVASGAAGEVQAGGTRAELVLIVSGSHGDAAPHFFKAQS